MTDLRTAAQQALEAMEYSGMDVGKFNRINAACAALRAALAQQAEPVKFWPLAPLTGYYDVGGRRVWLEKDDPFPVPAPPQRKPLTDEEIDRIDACIDKFTPLREGKRLFARAVERAHGIGEEK